MKKCCFKNIDKAVRKGRAHYVCVKCGGDVSLMWFYYQQAIEKNNEKNT
jgi:hypothetical protein